MKTQSLDPEILKNAAGSQSVGSVARRARRLENMPAARLILGVDPGLHRTGYGLVEVQKKGAPLFIEAGFLTAKAKDPMPLRLQNLFDGLCEVIKEFQPEVVVIEDLFSTYQHPRSALLMAHARGVFLLAAQQSKVPVHSFLPNEVKQVIAGNGHATKTEMQAAVKARLKLAAAPEPPDVADALAIALCFAARQETAARLK